MAIMNWESFIASLKIHDERTGLGKGLLFNAGSPQICAQDYLLALAEGDITGHTPFEKLGYSAGGTTTETDIWAGEAAYVFPTGAMQMECISSSTQDAAAGTGVKTVRLWYLDASGVEKTVDINLDGTNAVATSVSDIYRVQAFRAVSFGSGTTTYRAIGNIDIRHVDNTPVYSRIPIGATRARNSVYTVPAGKTLYVVMMGIGTTKASASGVTGTFTLRATYDVKLGALTRGLHFVPHAEINHQDGSFTRDFKMPLVFPENTDIKTSVICGQSATVVTCALRGWLE